MTVENAHKKLLDEAKKLLGKGVDGDKKAVNGAFEKLTKLRQLQPDNALIEAYYGSVLALMGRDAVKPLDKVDKAQEALDLLDSAVSMDPNDKEIRMLRASVCLHLPESYFQRSKTVIEDLTFLLDRYSKQPGFMSDKQVNEIRKQLRAAYKNAGKA